jgi:hypothetical protein
MKRIYKLSLPIILIACASCGDNDSTSETITLEEAYSEDLTVYAGEVLEVRQGSLFTNGASLILEGGSRLRFLADVQIQIQGSLIVNSENGADVLIEGSADSPRGSIRVSGDSLLLSNTTLEGLSDGVIADVESIVASNVDILDCEIGIFLSGGSGSITGGNLQRNTQALRLEMGQWQLQNLFVSNNATGIFLQENGGAISSSDFMNNTIAINSEASDTMYVMNNQFENNETALRYYYGRPYLQRNHFNANGNDVLLSAYPRHDVHILQNNFMTLDNFTMYIIEREWNNPHTLAVDDNFWNSTDSANIAQRIYDGYDHVPCDTLVFEPVATSAFAIN